MAGDHTERVGAHTHPPVAVAVTPCHAVPYGTDLLGIAFQALRARLRSFSPYGTLCCRLGASARGAPPYRGIACNPWKLGMNIICL